MIALTKNKVLRMKRLFVFTSFFPYGYQESFLEDEVLYLSQEFDETYFIPYCHDTQTVRNLPANCELIPSERRGGFKYLKMVFNKHSFLPFMNDFFNKRVFFSKVKIISWLKAYGSANYMLNSGRYIKILKDATEDDVFYFYWGKSPNILSCLYPCKAKKVSRFHGQWDLWEEEYGGYAPLRESIMKNLQAAVTISTIGNDYINRRYPEAKTYLYPLGTRDYGECIDNVDYDEIKVVSCSTVYPLKRVDLIFKSLLCIKDKNIKWVHIGSGPDFEGLKQLIGNTSHDHLKVELLGRMSHDSVMKYLKENKFNVFVNLSTLEGVPVSIMEAISFDIPIVATNVGGTPDVVAPECGILVSPNPSEAEVGEAIRKVIEKKYSVREFWRDHYSAERNYGSFAKFLRDL